MNNSLLRQLPGIGALLESEPGRALAAKYGHELTATTTRQVIDELRERLLKNPAAAELELSSASILRTIADSLEKELAPTLFPVINATGVIVHTNLGRATLSEAARTAISAAAGAYSNLEFDINSGRRGSRSTHAQAIIQKVTGAPAAHVVNNTASAVLLMLTALCQGREVIISRGQLVEIGGGFRVPDVMAQSGAKLVEVGTTNRTHLRDYATAINENTAAIMVAHHSNFKIVGFTTEPSLQELAKLAHRHDLPLLYDQGSGCLLDTTPFGLEAEPTVPEGIAAGCDLITFSGDKLLGGPQAGVMIGRPDLIARCKSHPLARAVRPDKLALAGLAATLTHFLKNEAPEKIPVWRMISAPLADIEQRAHRWLDYLKSHGFSGDAAVIEGVSTVGGGSLPGASMPTHLLAVEGDHIEDAAAQLRQNHPHVIGRIQDGQLWLDPRTVLPEQDEPLLKAILALPKPL